MSENSGTYFANMLGSMGGLGALMQTVQDPAFHLQIKAFVEAIGDIQQRTMRIEAKVDALLTRDGNDGRLAATFAQLGSDGVGACAVAGGAADDGARRLATPAGGPRNGSGAAGPDRIAGSVA